MGSAPLTIEEMHNIAEERNGKCLSTKYVNNITKLKWMCAEGHTWEAIPKDIKSGRRWCPTCGGSVPLTIEEMHNIAEERNGKCLSTKYVNSKTKLKWMCAEGHTWEAIPGSIKRGVWCPYCHLFLSEELCRTTFEQLFGRKFVKVKPEWLISPKGFAMELDGYCEYYKVAFEYNGEQHYKQNFYNQEKERLSATKTRDKLKSELCKANGVHLFTITYQDNLLELPKLIKDRSITLGLDLSKIDFARKIDFNKVYQHKTNLQEMHNIAEERNGKCLSTKYVNNTTKLKWMCTEGHTWEAIPGSIKRGVWCPSCVGRGRAASIEEMHNIAEERNGKCLSTKYVNSKTKLKWMCAEGHTWEARPSGIKSGRWCPTCGGSVPLTIEGMHNIAEERNGKCLSTKYVNSATKLKWMCAEGHTWEARPGDVKTGSWCSICWYSRSKSKNSFSISE